MDNRDEHIEKVILQCKIINMICERFERGDGGYVWYNPATSWMKPLWIYFQEHQFEPNVNGYKCREVMTMWENVRTLPIESLIMNFEYENSSTVLIKFVFNFRAIDRIDPKEFTINIEFDKHISMSLARWKKIRFGNCVPFVNTFNKLIEHFGEETA